RPPEQVRVEVELLEVAHGALDMLARKLARGLILRDKRLEVAFGQRQEARLSRALALEDEAQRKIALVFTRVRDDAPADAPEDDTLAFELELAVRLDRRDLLHAEEALEEARDARPARITPAPMQRAPREDALTLPIDEKIDVLAQDLEQRTHVATRE